MQKKYIIIQDEYPYFSFENADLLIDNNFWLELSANFLSTLIAAVFAAFFAGYAAYKTQQTFRKSDEQKLLLTKANDFNHALSYISIILEDTATQAKQLNLPCYLDEHLNLITLQINNVNNVNKEIFTGFLAINPMPVIQTDSFTKKIANIGKYPNILQNVYRLQLQMEQYKKLCEHRNFLIKDYIQISNENDGIIKENQKQKLVRHFDRYHCICDTTLKLLASVEMILDSSLFLLNEINKPRDDMLKELKLNSLEKTSLFKVEPNILYYEMLDEIKELLNYYPDYQGRYMWTKPPTPSPLTP